MRKSDFKIGMRIGRLTYKGWADGFYIFVCDCGALKLLKSVGWTRRSCGCIRKDYGIEKLEEYKGK